MRAPDMNTPAFYIEFWSESNGTGPGSKIQLILNKKFKLFYSRVNYAGLKELDLSGSDWQLKGISKPPIY